MKIKTTWTSFVWFFSNQYLLNIYVLSQINSFWEENSMDEYY